jgi:hypothetical protein
MIYDGLWWFMAGLWQVCDDLWWFMAGLWWFMMVYGRFVMIYDGLRHWVSLERLIHEDSRCLMFIRFVEIWLCFFWLQSVAVWPYSSMFVSKFGDVDYWPGIPFCEAGCFVCPEMFWWFPKAKTRYCTPSSEWIRYLLPDMFHNFLNNMLDIYWYWYMHL